MKKGMSLRKFEKKDTKEVAELISRTYKRFNSLDCFDYEASKNYINFFNPTITSVDQILVVFNKATIFYVVEDGSKIVGTIRGSAERISSLFVDGTKHRKGIGRKLLLAFEDEAAKQGSFEIQVRAQPYSVPFYEKMGYEKTAGVSNAKGLKVCPMKKVLFAL